MHAEPHTKGKPIPVYPIADYVTQELASAMTGYSVRAIESKRLEGIWVEGREWIRAPDGKPLISIQGYNAWAKSGQGSR